MFKFYLRNLNNNILVKIIVLCRTDMFDRLPGQNLNKIKQDNSFTFTWYREGVNSNLDSALIKLVNIRARLTYPMIKDIFEEFFPKSFDKTDIRSALLDYTRHTPRDFVQLMNYIKRNCDDAAVSTIAINKAVKEYSTEYFKQEISNELAGYFSGQAIASIFNVLSSISQQQRFGYKTFITTCKLYSDLGDIKPFEIMRVLYDCSAIGHTHFYKENGSTRVLFKYRNRASAFNPMDKILLHKGLWKALNVSL
ncbi:MAG: P-loop ATPase, Sll1717 family [Floccifex sp.]